ncbi:MAG: lytic murein transglycosylase B [Dokdonella sp.]|uniref:lytic murein transglycosylase B n=1 Tax=Dokdonella sp. TaxID=2291710 RepID=UPI0032631E7F
MPAHRRLTPIRIPFLLICALVAGSAFASIANAGADPTTDERAFAAEVAKAGGPSEASVLATLADVKVQQSILDAIARPAEATKPWRDYRPIFVTQKRIDDGIAFYRANRALLDRTSEQFGVPPEVIVAIIGVETSYGRNTGKYRVLDALGTLAFHYPPRAPFFRGELKQLFLLGDGHLAVPLDELRGSYAGAMGWGQFMPTSIAKWAKDGDGDGHIDLWGSLPDITGSVANYFREHGWEPGQPVAVRAQPATDAREINPKGSEPVYPLQQMEAWGYAPLERIDAQTASTLLKLDGERGPEYWLTFRNFYVITRYNKSPMYSLSVWQLAQAIAAGVASPASP